MKTNVGIYIDKQIRHEVNNIDTITSELIDLIEHEHNENDLELLEHLYALQNCVTEWQENKHYI
jgi:hypothetical protein